MNKQRPGTPKCWSLTRPTILFTSVDLGTHHPGSLQAFGSWFSSVLCLCGSLGARHGVYVEVKGQLGGSVHHVDFWVEFDPKVWW